MKASARFDLLSRVIFAAFIVPKVERSIHHSISDPRFLIRAPGFTLAEETNPRSQQPARDQSAGEDIKDFPDDYRDHAIGDGGPDDGIAGGEKEKMQRRDEQEPAETESISPNEFAMSAQSGAQSFVVKHERNLDGSKRNDQRAHDEAFEWEIVEHAGHVAKISQEQRRAH